MALITATAFLLAVRLNALVVAILGMLGGFLTPILLSTGQDNPLGLFGYIAILDAGLIFVALNKRWHFLTALAALGTVIMQIGWAGKFFESRKNILKETRSSSRSPCCSVSTRFGSRRTGCAWSSSLACRCGHAEARTPVIGFPARCSASPPSRWHSPLVFFDFRAARATAHGCCSVLFS